MEFAISYMNSYTAMVTADQLMGGGTASAEQQDMLSRCNIYIIAARPVVRYKPESISHENDRFGGVLTYRIAGSERLLPFDGYRWTLEDDAINLACPYPHLEVHAVNPEGKLVTYMPANAIATMYTLSEDERADLNAFQVLYVGQAIGDGSRGAMDRLISHSTLQKILARAPYDHPDQEIAIFMYQFDHSKVHSSMGVVADSTIDYDESDAGLLKGIPKPPEKREAIGVIEAALIRYFQPVYNEKFKNKFPHTKQKVLKPLYDRDISGLFVELDSSELGIFLSSPTAEAANHHLVMFDLVAPLSRSSYFDVLGISEMPGIIKAT
ncbi:hypothetical protein [Pseudomonas putida]|uniref:hypothetical protein n=1 Tax=Pseudomonas putida TaxID=303 RepID=UPI00235DBC8E|nr:hypothetical protein [Pseudomonas putida]GLO25453.1 hypothetical protein PPUJ21368_32820 [Pseudomonas putida]HDS0968592.1 hypothetical protein [Pseudomonas putida]